MEGGVIYENVDVILIGFVECGSVDLLCLFLLLFVVVFIFDIVELVFCFVFYWFVGVVEFFFVELVRFLCLFLFEDLVGSGGLYLDLGLVEFDFDFWGLRIFILWFLFLDGGW